MPPLSSQARSLLHLYPLQPVSRISSSSLQCLAVSPSRSFQQRRTKASAVDANQDERSQTPTFDSPFKNEKNNPTTKIPDFKAYMSRRNETTNRTFQYFMAGTMGLLTAAGAKATVQGNKCSFSISSWEHQILGTRTMGSGDTQTADAWGKWRLLFVFSLSVFSTSNIHGGRGIFDAC